MDYPPPFIKKWGSRGQSPWKRQGFTAFSMQNTILICFILICNTFFLQIFTRRKKVEGIYPPVPPWILALALKYPSKLTVFVHKILYDHF